MHKDRLLKLADYMEKVDAHRYNQDRWFGTNGVELTHEQVELGRRSALEPEYIKVTIKEGACNTAACVLGHAVTAVPEAKLSFYTFGLDILKGKDGTYTMYNGLGIMKTVRGKGVEVGAFAGAAAFGIPLNHASVLFGASDNRETVAFYGEFTPTNVAAKLREYVATNGEIVQALINA